MNDHFESVKNIADGAAATAGISVAMGWMPHAAGVLTVAWLAVRLFNEIMLAIERHKAGRKTECK